MHHFRHKKHQVEEQKKERKKSTRQKRMSVLFGSVYKCFMCVIGYKKKKKAKNKNLSLVLFFKIWSGGRIIVLLQWNGTCQNNWSLSPTFIWDMFKISTVIFAHFAFSEWCFFLIVAGRVFFCWKSFDENSNYLYFK